MSEVNDTLQQRHKTYGEYATQARIAQQLKDVMHDTTNWHILTYAQRESLDMIAAKISRILNGDPDHIDSWHDIGGYARLVEDRIHEVLDRPVSPVL